MYRVVNIQVNRKVRSELELSNSTLLCVCIYYVTTKTAARAKSNPKQQGPLRRPTQHTSTVSLHSTQHMGSRQLHAPPANSRHSKMPMRAGGHFRTQSSGFVLLFCARTDNNYTHILHNRTATLGEKIQTKTPTQTNTTKHNKTT